MSKMIAYCSLEEAWGPDFSDRYQKPGDSMLPKMPEYEEEKADQNILKEREITKMDKNLEKYYLNKKKEIKKDIIKNTDNQILLQNLIH